MFRSDILKPRQESGFTVDALTVLESTTDSVIVFDPDWRIVYANQRAKQMLQLSQKPSSANIWQAFPRPPGSLFETACRKAMAQRVTVRCEDSYAPLGMWFENCIYPCGDGIAVYFRDITEQKRQAEALRHSEELARHQLAELETIYASAPAGLAVFSPDLHWLRVNDRLASINGIPVAAHMGKTLREVLPQLADRLEAIARRVLETGEPVLEEVEGETPAHPGDRRAWIAQWSPQKDAAGKIVAINVVVNDVTQHRRVERELRDKAEEMQAVFDAVPAAVFVAHDPDCRTMTGNRASLELLRLPNGANPSKSAGDAAPRNFRALKDGVEIAPQDLPVQKAAATGQEVRGFEMELAFDNSDAMHIYGNATPLFDATGKPRGAVGAFVDVTEIAAARQEALRRHDTLENLVAARTADRDRLWRLSSDLMLVGGFDRIIRAVNPAWATVLGWTDAEVIGRHVEDLIHPDDRETTARGVRLLTEGAIARRIDNRYRHKDGSYRWITWTSVQDDGVIHAVGRDITDEKARTEALELSAARMRSIFETSYQYQGLLSTDGTLLDANATSLEGIEARLEDVVGRKFWDTPWFTGTPGLPQQVEAAVPLVAAGQTVRQEILINLPTGRRAFDFAMRPVRNATGEVIAIVPEAVELTERRAAEEQLRQVQKMEAVGQLTGGLAHDFNNLLTGITASLDLLGTRLAQGRVNALARYLSMAQGATRRAATLTHRLLAFSRQQRLDARPTDVNRLVASMEDLVRRTAGPEITFEVRAAEGLWHTLVDQNQLESALLNLCINARDAMPHGGRLTIETGNEVLDETAARELQLSPGAYVALGISDTGAGMAPEVIARAFDPFFTTKPVGAGTGLGLSMVYGFARQSGGQVHIHSTLGVGTTVRLYLPRHLGTEDAAELPVAPVGERQAGHGETVLVVDDEPTIRILITDVLEELGYTALEAHDGVAGLHALRSDQRIDLLVTDVGLPGGMNGRQLADAGRAMRADLKVLFITGYAEEAAARDGIATEGMHVLSKPFAIETLVDRIKDILAGV